MVSEQNRKQIRNMDNKELISMVFMLIGYGSVGITERQLNKDLNNFIRIVQNRLY